MPLGYLVDCTIHVITIIPLGLGFGANAGTSNTTTIPFPATAAEPFLQKLVPFNIFGLPGVGAGAFGLSVLTGLLPLPGWYGPLTGIVVPGE
jgi:hypothetical protein